MPTVGGVHGFLRVLVGFEGFDGIGKGGGEFAGGDPAEVPSSALGVIGRFGAGEFDQVGAGLEFDQQEVRGALGGHQDVGNVVLAGGE